MTHKVIPRAVIEARKLAVAEPRLPLVDAARAKPSAGRAERSPFLLDLGPDGAFHPLSGPPRRSALNAVRPRGA